jgi:hypothetical protein
MRDVGAIERGVPGQRVGTGSTGAPNAATAPAAQTVQPAAPADQPAVQVAASLARLLAGGTLTAVVTGRDGQGWPVVATANGQFALQGGPALAPNTTLLLQVVAAGEPLRALVLQTDGHALRPPPAVVLRPFAPPGTATAAAPASGGANAGTAPPAPSLPAGTTVGAIVIAEPPAGTHSPLAGVVGVRPAIVPRNTELGVAVRQFLPPPAAPTAPPETAAAVPAPSGGAAASGPLATLGTGTRLDAVVAAHDWRGHPVVHTTVGDLALRIDSPLPAGSRLLLEVTAVDLPPAPPLAEGDTPADILLRLGHDWPALRAALAALEAAAPAVARQLIEALPQPNARLGSAALAFLSALRGGDLAGWLGAETVDALRRHGGEELVHRLAEDFRQVAQLARDETGGDWRILLLPVFDGEQVRQVAAYMRRRRRRDDGSEQEGGTRFLVDLELAATGAMQIDGLVRGRQLDLVLRSALPFEEAWRHDIDCIFADALGATGMTGALSFQIVKKPPAGPLGEIAREAPARAITA